MKLATLNNGSRDGQLIVVNRAGTQAVIVESIATTMQQALDDWSDISPQLQQVYEKLNDDAIIDVFALDTKMLAAPLPRAYQFLDGSAYLPHVERVRKARGAQMPPSFLVDPLMYQATSDNFLAAHADVVVTSEDYGIDFESEVTVIVDDVPMAVSVADAASHIKLICIINDVSLRNLIPAELGKGFGFVQSKPPTALSPFFVTPDELGDAWRDTKVHLPLHSKLNGQWFGSPDAGVDMQFNFAELIAHAAKTRPLEAGAMIGSGTIANKDESLGSSCLAEKRVLEIIKDGKAVTPFMSFGDDIEIKMVSKKGENIFGTIHNTITKA
ncbi:Fumarylacetoacetate hydrolase family protein [hydrothermal vent metagenome]|uniref:Fumarylacetoacetate hydrolase family protein n=1 Tax=hydrothermal vent metagenome TaxID=652676 RepID=A0A3B0VDR5_9ZZZZ